jgi:hypothetical protein
LKEYMYGIDLREDRPGIVVAESIPAVRKATRKRQGEIREESQLPPDRNEDRAPFEL